MDKKKARKFLEEVRKLEEKYGVRIASGYEEEIDYDYEENPYVIGINSFLVLVDEEGYGLSIDLLEDGCSICRYCNRHIDGDDDFCNKGCEAKFKARKSK